MIETMYPVGSGYDMVANMIACGGLKIYVSDNGIVPPLSGAKGSCYDKTVAHPGHFICNDWGRYIYVSSVNSNFGTAYL
jgi:hypothetical protein